MKSLMQMTGAVLVAAAAAAVFLGAARIVPALQFGASRHLSGEAALHFSASRHLIGGTRPVPATRPQAGRVRRRCVRLGWKAPYWYAGS